MATPSRRPLGARPGNQWQVDARTLDMTRPARPVRRARIAAAFHHALARPELAQRLQAAGATPAPSTPQQMEDFVRAEIEHYTTLARSTGIKGE